MSGTMHVKTAFSANPDPVLAVAEIAQAIDQPDMAAVLFFASSRYDLGRLAQAVDEAFACPVAGCTTAGEFVTGAGYLSGTIVAASIGSRHVAMHTHLVSPVSTLGSTDAVMAAMELQAGTSQNFLDPERMFALLLVDGLTAREERVIALLQGALGDVPVVGGSAGDDMQFRQTAVYHGGDFHPDAALVALFETDLPFAIFQTHHFIRSDRSFVITAADPATRTVFSIDGLSAAQVYADALGVAAQALEDWHFTLHPFILRLGGQNYVRTVGRVNADGSLVFMSPIDQGLVLHMGTGRDMVYDLDESLHRALAGVPRPKLLIGCECVHRRLEAERCGLTEALSAVLREVPHVGFHTYGEQVDGLHVNQTFTGVILGEGTDT
ncbi:FIST N-terminal domain-containing protein [Desulfovibrio psychrotolerans]|uniref:Histidine kinase n=1 Tax=Desulfovibrio psychrotolerans TaxID=415242 RepID=A0A7J0BTG4_9BACT|nr:FIST N-terminal domain-containing protein [Desulfovibrio psychrotolerans]GFM37007.1 hypothetical protein DSM19430T_16910 [Desulfovibrio psychrotolerans]